MASPLPAPVVSVLLVAYNAGAFLRPAVESVLAQTWRDLELVLIDNASNDGSVDALAALVADARLRIVRMETNLGQAGGWRAGAPLCRGEFVALMDADDIAAPGRLAVQVGFLRAHPDFGVVTTLAEIIDEKGCASGPAFSLIDEADIRRYAEFGMPLLFPTALLRRSLVERIGFHAGGSWAADYEFLTQALEITRVGCVPAVLYRYRRHERSMTLSGRSRQSGSAAFTHLRAAHRRRGDAPDPNLSEAAEAAWLANPANVRAMHLEFAARATQAGFPALAVLHARRARAIVFTVGTVVRGVFRTPPRAGFLLKLALWGPVYALGVRTTVHPAFGWRQAITLGRAGAPKGEPL